MAARTVLRALVFVVLVLLLLGKIGVAADSFVFGRTLDSGNSCPATGTATDAAGNIYIACAFRGLGQQIRKVSLPAYTSALVLTSYNFGNAWGIACDQANNILYVSERGGPVHKAPLGAGAAAPSVLATGFGNNNNALSIDTAGNLYLADRGNGRIMMITPAGSATLFWDGLPAQAVFIDSSYIYAGGDTVLKKLLLASRNMGNTITTALSSLIGGGIYGICSDAAGNVYVADMGSNAVYILDPTMQTKATIASGYGGVAGVSLDASGNVLVSDYGGLATYLYSPRLSLFTPTFLRAESTVLYYTGAPQTFVVPAGATMLQIDACGAEGGKGASGVSARGGYIQSRIPATPGQTLFVYVGGSGNTAGYNGGGVGGGFSTSNGGGGTDIRTGNGGDTGSANVDTRLVVAGGAGSTNNGDPGVMGSGGGLVGAPGTNNGGTGGSQTAGGLSTPDCSAGCMSGLFWAGASPTSGRGGGGGWYGGGGGSGNTGAGGGSSYTTPAGTIVTNTQGDYRCVGNGFLAVTVTYPDPTPAPSPFPTPFPTLAPSPFPTISPTRVFHENAQADFFWVSQHNGPHCNSSAVGFSIKVRGSLPALSFTFTLNSKK